MGDAVPEEPSNSFLSRTRFRCYSCFPCFASSRRCHSSSSYTWWKRGVRALMKIREWSEIVAGPRWKTFIRRFNKTHRSTSGGKFQYDPLSYALNFDEGQHGAGDMEDVDHDFFSSRYATVSGSSNNNFINKDVAVIA